MYLHVIIIIVFIFIFSNILYVIKPFSFQVEVLLKVWKGQRFQRGPLDQPLTGVRFDLKIQLEIANERTELIIR